MNEYSLAKVQLLDMTDPKTDKRGAPISESSPLSLFPLFAHAIGVYAGALGRGQIINAPPAHLQENERDDEHPESKALAMVWKVTIVHIDKIGQPGDGRPRFLGVPRPVVPPCLLGPESTEEHANSKEGEAYIDEIIGDV